MERLTRQPNDKSHWLEMRSENLNSTEISALFGVSPYQSEFELWHTKKDKTLVDFQENERTKWGKRLEAGIAQGLAEENEWSIRAATEYISLPVERLGSSFDYFIIGPDGPIAILEIKNVDALQFKEKWIIDEGNMEAPLHIELQVQQQMLVSGIKLAYIGALIGGNKVVLIKREYDQAVGDAILKKAKKFWSLDEAPPPNFEMDAEFISKLYGFAEVGSVIEANEHVIELLNVYATHGKIARDAEKIKAAAKAEILTLIGPAEKVIHSGGSLSCGMIASAPVSYVREPYRNFKPYWKKIKETI